MLRYLFDTDIVIYVLKRRPLRGALYFQRQRPSDDHLIHHTGRTDAQHREKNGLLFAHAPAQDKLDN